MGFFKYAIECFTVKYFCFSGRSNRKEYWSLHVLLTLIYLFIMMIGFLFSNITSSHAGLSYAASAATIFYIFSTVPYYAMVCRRVHDLNRSSVLFLILVVVPSIVTYFVPRLYFLEHPVFGLIPVVLLVFFIGYFIICAFVKGTEGDNKHGPEPR